MVSNKLNFWVHRFIPKCGRLHITCFSVDIGLEMPNLTKLHIVVPNYSTTFRTFPIAIVLSVTKQRNC